MSVTGILSSSLFDYSTQSAQGKLQQSRQVFQQLGQDLQSGNLSAAQTDFAALPPSGSSTAASTLLQSNSPISQDYKQLSQDLQSGNLSSAQQDYAKLQQDFQNQVVAKHGHHHHGGGGGASGVSQLMQELGQELQSGNLSAAQQAYSTLQQELPQFAQDNGAPQPSSAPNSNSVSVSA